MALARTYARERRRLLPVSLVLSAGYFFGWWALVQGPLVAWLGTHVNSFDLQVLIFMALFGLGGVLVGLPLDAYEHTRSVHYGLSVQTWRSWWADLLKGLAVAAVLGLPLVLGLYRLLAVAPTTWWLWAGLFYLVITVLLAQLAPVLIMPLFFKFTPYEDEGLTPRLAAVAAAAGTQVAGVFRTNLSSKTTAANAWLSGMGRTRRIVLGDTLLEKYPADEIVAIFAHEMGHHVHNDLWRGIAVSSAVSLVGFWIAAQVLAVAVAYFGYSGPADLAAFPFLVLVLAAFGFVTSPLLSAYSRRQEWAADRYALTHGPGPAACADAFTRLANQNLADPEPPRWQVWFSYSHPPILQRIAAAERPTTTDD